MTAFLHPMPDDRAATIADRAHMERAYALAREAAAAGNHPFAALLVHRGELLAIARNEVVTRDDLTRHAELALVARLGKRLPPATLAECTLYASTEPCVMCAGAIFWAGVGRLVYGTTARQMAAVRGRPYRGIPVRELFAGLGAAIRVVGPVGEDVGLEIHAACWGESG